MKTIYLLTLSVFILFACKKEGPPGPKGDKGDQGVPGPKSITIDFAYVHKGANPLGINYDNQILRGQGGLTKYYNRNSDGIIIYMKAGATDNNTTNFTLTPLPVTFSDSIKFEYRLNLPKGVGEESILDIYCYVPKGRIIYGGDLVAGYYPYGKRDTTVYYRAVIIKGDSTVIKAN